MRLFACNLPPAVQIAQREAAEREGIMRMWVVNGLSIIQRYHMLSQPQKSLQTYSFSFY